MADQFTICRRCGSDVCYEVKHESAVEWRCMDCGFYSNTYMFKDGELVKSMIEESPDLFNDLAFLDDSDLVWFPLIINIPKIGIITPIGPSKDNWKWAYIPEVEIPTTDRHKYPILDKPGEYHTHRADMTQAQYFGQLDYILALQAANLLNSMV